MEPIGVGHFLMEPIDVGHSYGACWCRTLSYVAY